MSEAQEEEISKLSLGDTDVEMKEESHTPSKSLTVKKEIDWHRKPSLRRGSKKVLTPTKTNKNEEENNRRASTTRSLTSHRRLGDSEEERKALKDDAVKRLEKEKGRKLTKIEMTTTMKALVMYNSSKKRKSLKKKKKQKDSEKDDDNKDGKNENENGEGNEDGEEDDDLFDEDLDYEEELKRLRVGEPNFCGMLIDQGCYCDLALHNNRSCGM